MRRIAFSGLALALTLGTAPMLAAQQPAQAPAARQHEHGRHRRQNFRREGLHALFRGVNLTAQQKTQLKQINQKYRARGKEIRESLRPALQQARADRQKGDRDAARAVFQQYRPQFDRLRQLRKQELGEVRGILTPPQRQDFDRNVAQLRTRMQQRRGERQGPGSERQGQRRGDRS